MIPFFKIAGGGRARISYRRGVEMSHFRGSWSLGRCWKSLADDYLQRTGQIPGTLWQIAPLGEARPLNRYTPADGVARMLRSFRQQHKPKRRSTYEEHSIRFRSPLDPRLVCRPRRKLHGFYGLVAGHVQYQRAGVQRPDQYPAVGLRAD